MPEPRTGPMRDCKHCGESFQDFRKGRNSRFCSMKCAYDSRVIPRSTCRTCGNELLSGAVRMEQRPDRPRATYVRGDCNACRSEARNQRRAQSNLDAVNALRRDKKYGLAPGQYDAMHESQGGLCAICHEPPNARGLFVDHHHGTGKVRGLLCHSCNAGIGLLKDSPRVLVAASEYLERAI